VLDHLHPQKDLCKIIRKSELDTSWQFAHPFSKGHVIINMMTEWFTPFRHLYPVVTHHQTQTSSNPTLASTYRQVLARSCRSLKAL